MKTKVIIDAFFGLFVYATVYAGVNKTNEPESRAMDINDPIRIAESHYNNKEYRLLR